MGTGQVINYDAIESKLNTVKQDIETAKNNLEAIDKLINQEIGATGTSWSGGGSATDFLNHWQELASHIPEFLRTMENQASSLQILLNKERQADQSAGL